MSREKLPVAKRTRAAEIDAELDRLDGYVLRWGILLKEYHDNFLWIEHYDSFKDYCEKRRGESVRTAYRAITFVEVREQIIGQVLSSDASPCRVSGSSEVLIPMQQAQALELAKAPEADRPDIWNAAVKDAKGQQPTAKQVKAAVSNSKPKAKPKTGQVVFDTRPFADLYGKLGRFLDQWNQRQPSLRYGTVRNHMNAIHMICGEWMKEKP